MVLITNWTETWFRILLVWGAVVPHKGICVMYCTSAFKTLNSSKSLPAKWLESHHRIFLRTTGDISRLCGNQIHQFSREVGPSPFGIVATQDKPWFIFFPHFHRVVLWVNLPRAKKTCFRQERNGKFNLNKPNPHRFSRKCCTEDTWGWKICV